MICPYWSVTANIESLYSKLRTDNDPIFEFKIFSRTLYSNLLELHPESVFRFGIGRYFFGKWSTDTGGKLGKDFGMPVYCIYVLFHGSLHSCVLYLRTCSAVVDTISWCNTIPNIPTDKGR